MRIHNSEEVDTFCCNHMKNGVRGVKGDLVGLDGEKLNIAFEDIVTGEYVQIVYEFGRDG